MKLNLEQLKEITTGAINIKQENGRFTFSRFTAEQQKLYQLTNFDFYNKSQSTSGIKLSFITDSKSLFIKFKTSAATSRKYFSLDVLIDKKTVDYIDNFSDAVLPQNYTKTEYVLGEFSKKFILGDGEKTVCVHLPWSVKTAIEEISLDDNSFLKGIKPDKKLLAFGDSITQGYDALRPSNRYVSKLAEKLGAEEFNKGIGGERFFPKLARLKEPFTPDYITVAYGTNDWSHIDRITFKAKCKSFYENLSQSYPYAKIFSITPIWRKDRNEFRIFGAFEKVEEYIREAVDPIENITVISGYDLVPEDENCFADLRLHPNDNGFEYYEKNLYDKIKNII
ncbi:MAG: SGNH/GDSL hydrolase family protein [Ruminococcaceae bacterium]|nr:SGNH/GDSL hydrolase family protein [Oscillospiraceae bacterium]